MKKILLLNYEFPPLGGGASPVSYDIAHRLSLTGDFSIDVVTMGYGGLPKSVEINKNLKVYRVNCWRSKKELCHPWEQLTYLISGYFKCRSLIRHNKYDLCHVHFLIPTGLLAWILKIQFGIRYVVTAHGSDVPGFNPDRFKFLHLFTSPLLKKVGLSAEKIISPSEFLKKKIGNNIVRGLIDRTVVIPNGIDVKTFHPGEKKRYILATGRLLERKGFQNIIEALSDEDISYDLYICGDGPMMGQLRKKAEQSKTKIVFCGWLKNDSDEYLRLLSQATIYISASSVENASISLLEAMSSGCAVISSGIEANKKIIEDSGVFFKTNDSLDLKRAILSVVNNQGLLNEYQQKSRSRAVSYYDWDVIISKYISQFNDLLIL